MIIIIYAVFASCKYQPFANCPTVAGGDQDSGAALRGLQ